jgi:hypothetical protein
MADIGTSLCSAFDVVWARFVGRLDGLDDAEYLWEPVPDCWSIREGRDGRWVIEGAQWGTPVPDPPPVTTIAWRIGHIAGVAVGGFADWLFGDGASTVDDIAFPAHAAQIPEFCERNYRQWREGIGAIDEERWGRPLGPKWGAYAESDHVDLALHVLDEVTHHGGEVGLLRDLYLRRDQLG